jgi:hypothetical protein
MRKGFENAVRGLVPWPKEEFIEFLEFMNKLHQTPPDDWDLKRKYFSIRDDETGDVTKYFFNPLHIDYQVGMHLLKKYGNTEIYTAHMFRWWAIANFLSEHMSKLIKDKLMQTTDQEHSLMSEGLIAVFCSLPFSEKRINEGSENYYFSYDDVSSRAKEFMRQEDQNDG